MSNIILYSGDEFFISYRAERLEFAKLIDEFCYIFGNRPEPKESPETALVVMNARGEGHHAYYILYGDHCKAYVKLVPNLDACMNYFMQNIDLIGHSSDMPDLPRM